MRGIYSKVQTRRGTLNEKKKKKSKHLDGYGTALESYHQKRNTTKMESAMETGQDNNAACEAQFFDLLFIRFEVLGGECTNEWTYLEICDSLFLLVSSSC